MSIVGPAKLAHDKDRVKYIFFLPWYKFYFPLLGMAMNDNEIETTENKNLNQIIIIMTQKAKHGQHKIRIAFSTFV